MLDITQKWIARAEGDWEVAGRVADAEGGRFYDHVCFHSHECTEKYLKARLVEADVAFPKTHNLPHLLTLVLPLEPSWNMPEPSLLGLKAFGVSIVYPGKSADKVDAQTALGYCREVHEAARRSFGLPL